MGSIPSQVHTEGTLSMFFFHIDVSFFLSSPSSLSLKINKHTLGRRFKKQTFKRDMKIRLYLQCMKEAKSRDARQSVGLQEWKGERKTGILGAACSQGEVVRNESWKRTAWHLPKWEGCSQVLQQTPVFLHRCGAGWERSQTAAEIILPRNHLWDLL